MNEDYVSQMCDTCNDVLARGNIVSVTDTEGRKLNICRWCATALRGYGVLRDE